jgi:DNA polymerase III epsilon subunit-like protein
MPAEELLVSVDIEASGPSPSTGSLLSIGACLVDDPAVTLYLELKPLPELPWTEEAAHIHQLDRGTLERDGLPPRDAMLRLADWLAQVSAGRRPVFVAFNAPFDWMFVNDYFQRFVGHNPFGSAALDMKAYYMGRWRVPRWRDTTHDHIKRAVGVDEPHTHNALDDAREQAHLMRRLRAGNGDQR